jgi:sulfur-oxidizing protein SoxX
MRRFPTVLLWILALFAVAAVAARADQLVMFEERGCPFCAAWDAEVAPTYPKTREAILLPLRRVDLEAKRPADLTGIHNVTFTPTFVAMHCGREVGRVTGYRGSELFWEALDPIVAQLGNKPCINASTADAGPPGSTGSGRPAPLVAYETVNYQIPKPLTAQPGDAARGQQVAVDRKLGNCLSCHSLPVDEADQGNVGPNLRGVGSRYSVGSLRLRIVNPKVLDPATIMPAYYRVSGLTDVSPAFAGRPILTAQQVEDVVAYLASLK